MKKFDELDIGIIHFLHDFGGATTSDIAKKIFECKTNKELIKNDSMVRARLGKLKETKVVLSFPTAPKTWNINPDYVFCGRGSLDIKVNGGEPLKIDFGDFIVITDGKEYVHVNRILKDENGKELPEIFS